MSDSQGVMVGAVKDVFPRTLIVDAFKEALPLDVAVEAFREGIVLFLSPFVGFVRAFSATQHRPTSENAAKQFWREPAPSESMWTAEREARRISEEAKGEIQIEAFEQALTVVNRVNDPFAWALINGSLGNAYMARAHGDRAENLERALECYERALTVRRIDDDPYVERFEGTRAADSAMQDAVHRALAWVKQFEAHNELARMPTEIDLALRRIGGLTPREREVLNALAAGRPIKHVAIDLGISARTVEVHRARIMERLGVHRLAEAIRLAAMAGLVSNKSREPSDR